jgi:iron-sulfur cluster insertion protein
MTNNQLNLSSSAAHKINQLVLEEMNPDLKFRVYIIGGGCSGFQYGFAFEEDLTEGDIVMEQHGVQMMVDPMSFPYLIGSKVDYLEDLQGSRFVVSNPNAKSTCGCGSSFSI